MYLRRELQREVKASVKRTGACKTPADHIPKARAGRDSQHPQHRREAKLLSASTSMSALLRNCATPQFRVLKPKRFEICTHVGPGFGNPVLLYSAVQYVSATLLLESPISRAANRFDSGRSANGIVANISFTHKQLVLDAGIGDVWPTKYVVTQILACLGRAT